MKHSYRPIVLLVAMALNACAASPTAAPTSAQSAVTGTTPLSFVESRRNLGGLNGTVVRYVIDGKPYYYVRSPCCDFFNYLYDSNGDYLCSPDGGFTGKGDGKCPDNVRVKHSEGVVVPNPFYKP